MGGGGFNEFHLEKPQKKLLEEFSNLLEITPNFLPHMLEISHTIE